MSAVRYPISTALCIAAIGAIAALLFFARPAHHAAHPGKTIACTSTCPSRHL